MKKLFYLTTLIFATSISVAQEVGSFYGSIDGTLATDLKLGKKSSGGQIFNFMTQDGGSAYLTMHSTRWGGGYTWSRESNGGADKKIAYLYGASPGHYYQLFHNDQSIKVQFHSNGYSYINGGNVGIGTDSPNATLHVPDGTAIVGGSPSLSLNHLNNSLGVISKDNNSSTYPFYVGQSSGADIFWVTGNGNGFFKGQVGVGTTTTGSHKLAVEGSIGAREIKVEATGWSDFVFNDDYELRTLEEVEKLINENGHLPEIPSEAEVIENGINLGEMNAKLLQKIEELTLYLIEQNKDNQEQQKLIEELQREVSSLKNE